MKKAAEKLPISFAEFHDEREVIKKENEPFGMAKLRKRCAGKRVEWDGFLQGCAGYVILLTFKPLETFTGNIPLHCYAYCRFPQKQLDNLMETSPPLKRGAKVRVGGILDEQSFDEGDRPAYLIDCEVLSVEAHGSNK